MPDSHSHRTTARFGTLPVFMTAISTILGAILFLRFGYAVGHLGFLGVIGIILLGHMVTIPTAMAVAEIATNQKVLGGGAYYIISRSFVILWLLWWDFLGYTNRPIGLLMSLSVPLSDISLGG